VRARTAALLPGQAGTRRQARLAAERLAQPSMAVVLEALSRALPDDAWLTRLEVEQRTVRLAGNAANASALIGRIEASGHFADVQFSAPTTLAEGEGESFTITARIVPGRRLD
jgi:general secretion pathway protein L